MPFKDDLQEVYDKAIKPACIRAGFESLRVDELQGPFNINRKIIEYLFSSDAIIADLTGWNPNVFYEMGVVHTLDNKTLMIIQRKDQLPLRRQQLSLSLIRTNQVWPGQTDGRYSRSLKPNRRMATAPHESGAGIQAA